MTRVFANAEDLTAAIGEHLGYSDWLTIDQPRIDAFAAATGDHQWIHVDAERAAGPNGSTIAHGYVILSLVPVLVGGLVDYAGWGVKINYGTDEVKFPSPVRVNSQVRAGLSLAAVRDAPSGIQVASRVTVDARYEGEILPRPALVAETLTLLIP